MTGNNNNNNNNVWFIAGASSGFGRAIGLEALRRGDKVVAAARDAKRLSGPGSLGEAGATVMSLDVTAGDERLRAALQRAVDEHGNLTHVVNAAGYILEGPIEGARYVFFFALACLLCCIHHFRRVLFLLPFFFF